MSRRFKGKSAIAGSSIMGYAMVLPALVLYSIFVFYPVIGTFSLSLREWEGIGPKIFVGLDNYVKAFGDPLVYKAFFNNLYYTFGTNLLGVFTGLFLAVLLSTKVVGRLVFQTIFFFPRLLAMVVVAVVWGWIFNPYVGILHKILTGIGLGRLSVGWLGNQYMAMPAIIVAGSWTYFGFCMVIFMAALQNTDKALEEAALIEGANSTQIFFRITLPQISNAITIVVITSIIDAFKLFDLIWVMTKGGPGDQTQILATHLYREAFRHNHYGYAATIAIILTAFVLSVSTVLQRYQERND